MLHIHSIDSYTKRQSKKLFRVVARNEILSDLEKEKMRTQPANENTIDADPIRRSNRIAYWLRD